MVKLIQKRVRVGPNGDAIVSLGAESAGTMVDVTVVPASGSPDLFNGLTREEWFRIFEQSAGSIDDPNFRRPPQENYESRAEFD